MLDFLGVRLDEAFARLRVIAHEPVEDQTDGSFVLQHDLQELAARRVHGGFPQLVGVHFAESLIALHRDVRAFELLEYAVALIVVPRVVNVAAARHAIEGACAM